MQDLSEENAVIHTMRIKMLLYVRKFFEKLEAAFAQFPPPRKSNSDKSNQI